MKQEIRNIEELKKYFSDNSIACPLPTKWNELFNMLKNKIQSQGMMTPSRPLILAAWNETTHLDKMMRFYEHLMWAKKEGQAKEVIGYLMSLKDDEWLYF
jgi:hypothetical protein